MEGLLVLFAWRWPLGSADRTALETVSANYMPAGAQLETIPFDTANSQNNCA